MKLYNEMKHLVRDTFSHTSKQFDGYFQKSSVEGYVEMKERLIYKQKMNEYKKILARNKPKKIDSLLEQMIALQKKKNNMKRINYANSNERTNTNENSNKRNIDDDINLIFKKNLSDKDLKHGKSEFSQRMKILQIKTQNKVKRRKIELSKIKERDYNPNYNSIYPKAPVCSFSHLPKNNKIRRVFNKEICTKFDKHEKQFNNIRLLYNDVRSLSSNITLQDNSYYNMGESTMGTISRNNSSMHSTMLHTKKGKDDLNISNFINYRNNNSSSSTLVTSNSHRCKKTKLKPLNCIK